MSDGLRDGCAATQAAHVVMNLVKSKAEGFEKGVKSIYWKQMVSMCLKEELSHRYHDDMPPKARKVQEPLSHRTPRRCSAADHEVQLAMKVVDDIVSGLEEMPDECLEFAELVSVKTSGVAKEIEDTGQVTEPQFRALRNMLQDVRRRIS